MKHKYTERRNVQIPVEVSGSLNEDEEIVEVYADYETVPVKNWKLFCN